MNQRLRRSNPIFNTMLGALVATALLAGCGQVEGRTNTDEPPPTRKELREISVARDYFVDDFLAARFSRCDDWFVARVNAPAVFPFDSRSGYFAFKGDPDDWSIHPIEVQEVDRLRGVTWYGDIHLEPDASIVFLEGLNGNWNTYQPGALALWMAAVQTPLLSYDTDDLTGYETLALQIFHNEKHGGWNVWMANNTYDNTEVALLDAWMLQGVEPVPCSKFPELP